VPVPGHSDSQKDPRSGSFKRFIPSAVAAPGTGAPLCVCADEFKGLVPLLSNAPAFGLLSASDSFKIASVPGSNQLARKMKKPWFPHNLDVPRLVTLLVLAVSLILPGCSDQPASAPSGKSAVVIKGSNTIGEELGPRLVTEYKKDHPNAGFDLESKGTGSGFWALIGGQCDVAAASRAPNADELKQAKERGVEFVEHPIASYSVAIIVNAASPLADLTRAQVRDVFTGAVKNWKEVGGPDAPIHLDIRDAISGTYLGFRELAMEDKPYPTGTNAFTSYAAIVQAVAQDASAVGYASLDLLQSSGIKALSIGGVAPARSSVNDGKYPYARLLRFYTSKGKEAPGTLEFIKFVESPKGQQVVAQSGNVPRS
jgi:phosphate transport system substrate-binding protein